MSLKADTRNAILEFMADVVASIQESEEDFSDVPLTSKEFERNFQVLEDDEKKGGLG